jgi:hypothetical protein
MRAWIRYLYRALGSQESSQEFIGFHRKLHGVQGVPSPNRIQVLARLFGSRRRFFCFFTISPKNKVSNVQ